MAITETVNLKITGLWPQGDARDPLGVWGARHLVTGDATAGSIKVDVRAAAAIAGGYVYTCYSAIATRLDGNVDSAVKCRLLTNWPDIDDDAGVQGYGTLRIVPQLGDPQFTAPTSGPRDVLVAPNDRFILLFDPRPVVGAFDIVALEMGENIDAAAYSFEAWGYYWDRSVLNAPGGPRHPGSA